MQSKPKKKLRSKKNFIQLTLMSITLLQFICKRLIEVNTTTTNISVTNIYTNGETSVYSKNSTTSSHLSAIVCMTSILDVELTPYSDSTNTRLESYYQSNIKNMTHSAVLWSKMYQTLYTANTTIKSTNNSTSLTSTIEQLLGEALLMRVFCFFYLANLYEDTLLVTTTNQIANNILPQNPLEEVCIKIIMDLIEAQTLPSINSLDESTKKETAEKNRPTQWEVSSLHAKSHLCLKDWKNTARRVAKTISNTALYKIDSLGKTFLMMGS